MFFSLINFLLEDTDFKLYLCFKDVHLKILTFLSHDRLTVVCERPLIRDAKLLKSKKTKIC